MYVKIEMNKVDTDEWKICLSSQTDLEFLLICKIDKKVIWWEDEAGIRTVPFIPLFIPNPFYTLFIFTFLKAGLHMMNVILHAQCNARESET